MRRRALLLGAVAALLFTSSGAAKPPSHFTFPVDFTVPSFLTGVCGFPVFVHLEGTARTTLFYDGDGNITREIDVNTNLMITFSAPSTGKSFSYPSAGPFIQDFINGTAVGSTLVATVDGILAGTGSTAPDAGRAVFEAVVIDTLPEGIPVVDLVAEISSTGHRNEDLAAARCAALSP